MGKWGLGHRRALDGLRGVAILLVVASHTGAPGLGALGSIGVTLFFVLSGFLITTLLLEEGGVGGIDLRGFYTRRVRRLAPALAAFVVAVAVASVWLGAWWLRWADVPWVLAYASNWAKAFDASEMGALSITWSLAIEEQFYLVWPLVVIALASRRRVLAAACVIGVTSLAVRAALLDGVWIRVYYGTDTAAFFLAVGCVLAALRVGGPPGQVRPWLLAGAAVVVAWCASWPEWFGLMVGLPLVAVACGAGVWAVTGAGRVRVLEGAVLRWLGSRSYGLYLIHGPILWAMRDHYLLPWWVVAAAGVPVSLLLAEVSYRWVESPFRARRSAPAPAGAETGAVRVETVSGTDGVRRSGGPRT